MCHPHRKIATINQLIKIESSSINYSEENEIILTYLGTTFTTFLIMKILHLLFVKFTNKFKISKFSKSFQNLKNVDIVCIFLLINSFSYFRKANFCILNISHTPTICDHFFSFLAYHPILKNHLHPPPYAHFWEVISPS